MISVAGKEVTDGEYSRSPLTWNTEPNLCQYPDLVDVSTRVTVSVVSRDRFDLLRTPISYKSKRPSPSDLPLAKLTYSTVPPHDHPPPTTIP